MSRRSNQGTESDKYPNAGVDVDKESCLPSHHLFRPELHVTARPQDIMPSPRTKRRLTQPEVIEELNLKTEEIIKELSLKGKFLPCDVVKRILLDLLQAAFVQHKYRISLREMSVFSSFSRLHGRIEELIKVYCMFTPITTLHELGIALALSEKVKNYEELHLGPLIKHPRVKDYFKPPDNMDSPPEITIHQLHGHLFKMMGKTKRRGKFSMEEYLEFVRKKQDLDSVHHLCVRLQSFPLLIQASSTFCVVAMVRYMCNVHDLTNC